MDIKTLVFLLALGNLVFGVMLILFELRNGRTKSGQYWGIAKFFQAVGWALLALRGILPDVVSVTIGNWLLLTGFCNEAWAMMEVAGTSVGRRARVGSMAGALFVAMVLIRLSTAWRIALASYYSAVFFGLSAGVLLRASSGPSGLRRYIGWSLVYLSLIVLARGTWAIAKPDQFMLFSENAVQIATFVAMYYLLLTNGFGLLLLSKERADGELVESEARLAQAQSIAHVGSWEYDLETQKFWASAEAFRIYGLERSSPFLPPETVQNRPAAEDRPRLDAAMDGLLQGTAPYDVEFTLRAEDGKPAKIIHSVAHLERDEQGCPRKVIGVIQDITERRKADKQLKELKGLIPICCSCKKIRDDKGYWSQIEEYVKSRSDADFSHGYCPECGEKAIKAMEAHFDRQKS